MSLYAGRQFEDNDIILASENLLQINIDEFRSSIAERTDTGEKSSLSISVAPIKYVSFSLGAIYIGYLK